MLKRKSGQNMIEVVLIIPLLIVIILGILEYALFQRNVNAVQDIATEATVVAARYYVDPNSGPFAGAYTNTENPAVEAALQVVRKRMGNVMAQTIAPPQIHDLGSSFGKRPFALYQFDSTETLTYKGHTVPRFTFTLDYRDPVTEGISAQVIYYYNLVLFGLEFSIPGVNRGRPITIIPKDIQLSSTQTREYVHY